MPGMNGKAPSSFKLGGFHPLSINSKSLAAKWELVPNESYQVEFSSNLRDWTLIPEVFSSPGATLQWIDAGRPRADSVPGVDRNNRYYRLISQGDQWRVRFEMTGVSLFLSAMAALSPF